MLRSSQNGDTKKKVKAIAIYDNFGRGLDELEFSKGDTIIIHEQGTNGRSKGEINGAIGYFPTSFIEMIENDGFSKEDLLKKKDDLIFKMFAEMDIAVRREKWFDRQSRLRLSQRSLDSISPKRDLVEILKESGGETNSPNTLRRLGHVKVNHYMSPSQKPHVHYSFESNSTTSMSLDSFELCYQESPLYEKNKQTKKVVHPFTKQEVEVKLQFARDCLGLVRINGHPIAGDTDQEKVINARNMIYAYTKQNQQQTDQIMELATQNLGIWLYDSYMSKHLINSDKHLIMTQTGCHYVDILMQQVVTEEHQLEIYFMGLFKIQEEEFLEDPSQGHYLKTTIEINLMKPKNQVRIRFSEIVEDLWTLIPKRPPIDSLNMGDITNS